ncbi:selenium-binding protein [Methanococcus voltae]|jgi:selenium-binding protein|uniref:Selenium-binding protein n=2 Tax=Methanococcus voltae TaxID=2188 RepID=A0A8J7RLS3_METVO|nr:selenium-binding protein [Methanococcus voltae]MBP2171889.1 selenium-binding protein [Methanococcus voltae]MBP2201156.1 selenium-binding protein [Methanococcus voltae]MCS3921879.1 selenium-binding protein [Methanococcus voltae PS]
MVFEDTFIITTANQIPGVELYTLGIVSATSKNANVDEIVQALEALVKAKEGGFALIGFTLVYTDGELLGYGTAVKADEGQFVMG